jgi:broad specificity phosphatase PhoE
MFDWRDIVRMSDKTLPTTILLVRHADVHNPTDIVYGRLPRFGQSTIGREEAARTADALAGEQIQAVYSSPHLRARETAGFIAALHPGVRVQVTPDLAEVKTGWQGTSNKIMAEKKFNFYRDRVNPDDEDVPDVLARLLRWIDRVVRRHAGQTIVGVTHGDPSMMMRIFFSGQEVTIDSLRQKDLYPAKGSITRLVFSGTEPARAQHPVVTYVDPSATQHQALEEAAEAARAARGETGQAEPWAGTSAEQAATDLPPTEAPMGTSETAAADGGHRNGAAAEVGMPPTQRVPVG